MIVIGIINSRISHLMAHSSKKDSDKSSERNRIPKQSLTFIPYDECNIKKVFDAALSPQNVNHK